MGNVNWMRARESELHSELFGDDLERILPVVSPGNSDSATFDNVLELLMLAGRSLPHAAMMMIPEAWRDREDLPDYLKGFYAFHSCLMEPWDGPASVAFTDGRVVGATLDRNGLRPGRWVETTDGYVVLGSEAGLLDIPPAQVRSARAACSPASCSSSTSSGGASSRTRRSSARSPARSPTASGSSATPCRSRSCRPRAKRRSPTSRCTCASAPSATRRRTCACCSRRWRSTRRSRSARWATTSRWRSSQTRRRRCSPTSSSCSRRSPTRRSTRSARKS